MIKRLFTRCLYSHHLLFDQNRNTGSFVKVTILPHSLSSYHTPVPAGSKKATKVCRFPSLVNGTGELKCDDSKWDPQLQAEQERVARWVHLKPQVCLKLLDLEFLASESTILFIFEHAAFDVVELFDIQIRMFLSSFFELRYTDSPKGGVNSRMQMLTSASLEIVVHGTVPAV